MNYSLLFLLYAIGSTIQINLVGTLSLTDLVIIIFFLLKILNGDIRKQIQKDHDIRYITKLYILLLFIQIPAEILVENEIENTMKGLAITILSYMKILVLWPLIFKHPRNIFWLFTWTCIVMAVIASPENETTAAKMLSGEEYSFFKFQIAPRIGEVLVILSLWRPKQKGLASLFIVAGAFCVILGARSTGLMIFLTGVVGYFYQHNTTIKRSILIKWGIIGSILCYSLFVVYVNAVLSGAIVSGNSSIQLQKAENPYNPLYALLSGRTESPASLAAISDSPWIGWGAWAEDPGWKYHIIKAKFQGEEFNTNTEEINIIPAHSVLLQTGVHNGIFALIVMGCILFFFIKQGCLSFDKRNPYLFLAIFSVMQLIWNGLFSPLSHLRLNFPIYFIFCMYAYRYKLYLYKTKKQ